MTTKRHTSTPTDRPFVAGDRDAEAAFDRWRARLDAAGVEFDNAGAALHVVGLLASREVALERLRRAVRAERTVNKRLRLIAAERRAAGDFRLALEHADRVFGALAVPEAEEVAAAGAVAVNGARVIPMPLREVPAIVARRGKAPQAIAQRILAALNASGRALTKVELRKRVPGDAGTFLRELKAMEKSGSIKRSGRGTKGDPFRYHR